MDVALVRAPNPSPYTLDGTNTWIVGRDPAWVVDPGPAIPAHVDAVAAAVAARGGAGGIALTHDHPDHAEGAEAMRAALGGPPVAAMRWPGASGALADGDAFGPLTALHVPGHAADHLVFVAGRRRVHRRRRARRSGSVFIAPGGGSLGGLPRRPAAPARARPRPPLPRATARSSRTRRRSSTSTSPTGSSASAASSRRWEAGARTDDELLARRLGRDPARAASCPRRGRCTRTSTSSARRAGSDGGAPEREPRPRATLDRRSGRLGEPARDVRARAAASPTRPCRARCGPCRRRRRTRSRRARPGS